MRLSSILIFLALVLSTQANAQFSDGGALLANQAPPTLGQANETETFLRVEEAYQLSTEVQNQDIALLWAIAPAYYLYKDRFSISAMIDGKYQKLDARFEKGKVKYDEYFNKELEVFYNSTEILISKEGLPVQFLLKIRSQGCADAGLCYPPQDEYYNVDLNSATISPSSKPNFKQAESANDTSTSEETTLWLPLVLLLAVAGGAILNLMPCVFPVLSIKALSIAKAQGGHKSHGWAYTAGAVVAFLLVAGAMLIARAGGQAVGWGFQLQSPVLVGLLAYLFFVMGLSLSGLANFGTNLMGVGQGLSTQKGLRGSFFTGVLAAVVASPCTAPFMGTALGYALTQTPVVSLSVFAALGFGMALPFLLICHIPKLNQYLPKPGPWMETLKQCLAFPLYLAAVWLLWVLGRQAGSDNMAAMVIGAIMIAFALWLKSLSPSKISGSIALAAVIGALLIPFNLLPNTHKTVSNEGPWQTYQHSKFAQHQATGRPIFINLTADWCITCLANERMTLSTDAVKEALERLDVITLKGDWTNYNAEITTLLNKHGRSGVPLYLLYAASGKGEPRILPQILRTDDLLEALEFASSN